MVTLSTLLLSLIAKTPHGGEIKPPVIEWRISRSVVPGEPLFLEFHVKEPSDEALAAAADRIGRSVIDPNVAPADGIDGGCSDLDRIWFSMPVDQALPSWRRYMAAGKIDLFLPSAAYYLHLRKEPAAQAFVKEIVVYIHTHRPDLDTRLEEALRPQSGHVRD